MQIKKNKKLIRSLLMLFLCLVLYVSCDAYFVHNATNRGEFVDLYKTLQKAPLAHLVKKLHIGMYLFVDDPITISAEVKYPERKQNELLIDLMDSWKEIADLYLSEAEVYRFRPIEIKINTYPTGKRETFAVYHRTWNAQTETYSWKYQVGD